MEKSIETRKYIMFLLAPGVDVSTNAQSASMLCVGTGTYVREIWKGKKMKFH